MAQLQIIPLGNTLPWYKFRINLSGTTYTLHFRFNSRSQRWIMDVNDSSDNPIVQGIPVLINRDLFGQYDTLPLPDGVMFAVDNTGNDTQPTQYSFGLDHTLYYIDESA